MALFSLDETLKKAALHAARRPVVSCMIDESFSSPQQ